MARLLFLCFVCSMVNIRSFGQHDHSTAVSEYGNKYFILIRGLVGNWTGHFQWSTNQAASGDMNAEYSVTGNGTAIVEDLISQDKKVMTSVYHMDGPYLRMTHYCGAGNQPRLIADTLSSGDATIHFKFVDITNLLNEEAGHVYDVELNFISHDKLNIVFKFMSKGKESDETVELTRKKT
jgi:hypothetical protein